MLINSSDKKFSHLIKYLSKLDIDLVIRYTGNLVSNKIINKSDLDYIIGQVVINKRESNGEK